MKNLFNIFAVAILVIAVVTSCNKKEEVKETVIEKPVTKVEKKEPVKVIPSNEQIKSKTITPCSMVIECADSIVYKYCVNIDFPGRYVKIHNLLPYNYFRPVEDTVIFNDPGVIVEFMDGSFKFFNNKGKEFKIRPSWK